jgi:uncharacterized membrane protein YciS (DUF1049 family)
MVKMSFNDIVSCIDNNHNVISALAAVIALVLTVFGFIISFYYIRKQVKHTNEQARRIKSIDLVERWSEIAKGDNMLYTMLAIKLRKEQIESIRANKSFYVYKDIIEKHAPHLLESTNEGFKTSPDSFFVTVSNKKSYEMKTALVEVLNVVELIAHSYYYGAIDYKTIDKGFNAFFIEHRFLDDLIKVSEYYSQSNKNGAWPMLKKLKYYMEMDEKLKEKRLEKNFA